MTTPRRGRKTAEEEARDYLRKHGIDPDTLQKIEASDLPDPEQMFEDLLAVIYSQSQSNDLKGAALVNGLRLVRELAEESRKKREKEEVVEERDIEDILADAGLPAERRIEIGLGEVERLRARTTALQLVIAKIEGEG